MTSVSLTDEQTSDVIEAVLELAVRVRDEVGPGVRQAALDALAAAGGDPLAALTVAAALIRADAPLDLWWQQPTLPMRLAPCGTHSAYNRHISRREPVDAQCRAAERVYQRSRPDRRTDEHRAATRARMAALRARRREVA